MICSLGYNCYGNEDCQPASKVRLNDCLVFLIIALNVLPHVKNGFGIDLRQSVTIYLSNSLSGL